MPRTHYKYDITDKDKETAENNQIPLSTVYARLKRGWEVDRAVTESPRPTASRDRNANGEILTDVPKGKGRFFQVPAEREEELDEAIAASGLSGAQWYADAILAQLDAVKKKSKK
jgi:hypothetical protein